VIVAQPDGAETKGGRIDESMVEDTGGDSAKRVISREGGGDI